MLTLLRPTLLLALFCVTQLIALPLAWSGGGWNELELEPGTAESCCCSALAGPISCAGCTPVEDPEAPDGQEEAKSDCPCAAAPSMPSPEAPNEPLGLEPKGPEGPQLLGDESGLAKVWPSIVARGARAAEPPPRVARKSQPVFTQAFRL